MATTPPAYQRYPKDILTSPTYLAMDWKMRGIYNHLLDHAWLQETPGTFPTTDLAILKRSVGLDVRLLRDFFKKFPTCFQEINGNFVNERLDAQWLEMQQRSALARKAADKRWEFKDADALQTQCSPSSTASAFKSNEGKKEGAIARSDQNKTPAEPRKETQTPATEQTPKYTKAEDVPREKQAEYLAGRLFASLGFPKHHLKNLRDWERELDPLCDQFEFPELYRAIRWAVVEDLNWPRYIRRPKNIVDNAEKIVDRYRAWERGKESYQRARKQEAAPKVKKSKQAPFNYGKGTIELQGKEEL